MKTSLNLCQRASWCFVFHVANASCVLCSLFCNLFAVVHSMKLLSFTASELMYIHIWCDHGYICVHAYVYSLHINKLYVHTMYVQIYACMHLANDAHMCHDACYSYIWRHASVKAYSSYLQTWYRRTHLYRKS